MMMTTYDDDGGNNDDDNDDDNNDDVLTLPRFLNTYLVVPWSEEKKQAVGIKQQARQNTCTSQ